MNDIELKIYIQNHPNSPEARAYHMGLKDKALELSRTIERFEYLKPERATK
ncbi:MAG: hypothetical protein M0R49_09805 [Limnochordia bacterium]|nr:hypothetical protein [Limnochordia bacterium]